MCIEKIKQMFKKKKQIGLAKELPPEEKRWLSLKWFKQIFRTVDTSYGGLDLPKFQRCHDCYSWAKRARKTGGGAYYRCHNHGEFFVRASKRQVFLGGR